MLLPRYVSRADVSRGIPEWEEKCAVPSVIAIRCCNQFDVVFLGSDSEIIQTGSER